jgi:AcrR family transcriptional regulator
MLATVMAAADPFIQAVDEARRELSRQQGRDITNAELARMAGVKRSTLYYHLNNEVDRASGHRVPQDIVRALAAVLPIGQDELMKAAQVAAGYQVRGESSGDQTDYGFEVARFLDSDNVSEEDKAALALRLSEILADHLRRSVPSPRRNTK